MSGRAGDLTRIVTFLIGRSKDGMNKFVEGGREGRPRGSLAVSQRRERERRLLASTVASLSDVEHPDTVSVRLHDAAFRVHATYGPIT